MPFSEAVGIALAALRANKLRSLLTVLGILIGVSSVVAVVAITNGLDRYIAEQVLELGTRSFSVQKMPLIITSHNQFVEMNKRKDVTLDDMRAIHARCDACAEVGAQIGTSQDVKFGSTLQESVRIMGITENYSRIGSVRDLIAGRHLMRDDVERARHVAVIGTDVSQALFANREPLARTISVAGNAVRVIGVAEPKGSVFGASQDNFVWLPMTTFQKFFGSRRSVTIQVEAVSMEALEEAQDQARLALRIRRHLEYRDEDDFEIETGESVMDLWQSATQGIYFVTFVVTAISLLVGGVVVMNIMLVSVTERIREIGIRKALGARRRDILRQFLVESVLLAVAGGTLGVVGAAAFAYLLGLVLGRMMGTQFATPIQLWAVGLAVAMSSLVGLFAGIYPASRAAALDPVEALRSE